MKIRLLNEMDQLDLDEAKKKAEEVRRKQSRRRKKQVSRLLIECGKSSDL